MSDQDAIAYYEEQERRARAAAALWRGRYADADIPLSRDACLRWAAEDDRRAEYYREQAERLRARALTPERSGS